MPDYFTEVAVLRSGDSAGNGMTLALTDGDGRRIHTVAVPQEGHSHTGPTWAYIFENEGLTLIDPGAAASFDILQSGMALFGRTAADVERVVITHGHADHDGGVAQLLEASGAEFWAHDIYEPLLPFDPRDLQLAPTSPIKEALWATARANGFGLSNSEEAEPVSGRPAVGGRGASDCPRGTAGGADLYARAGTFAGRDLRYPGGDGVHRRPCAAGNQSAPDDENGLYGGDAPESAGAVSRSGGLLRAADLFAVVAAGGRSWAAQWRRCRRIACTTTTGLISRRRSGRPT